MSLHTLVPTCFLLIISSAVYPAELIEHTNADGDVYEGEIKNGQFNGFGKYTFASGEIYEGQFKDNNTNGFGKDSPTELAIFMSGNTKTGEEMALESGLTLRGTRM